MQELLQGARPGKTPGLLHFARPLEPRDGTSRCDPHPGAQFLEKGLSSSGLDITLFSRVGQFRLALMEKPVALEVGHHDTLPFPARTSILVANF